MLGRLHFNADGIEVSFEGVKEIEGNASVTIRKQKQIFLYEFEIDIYFEAHELGDSSKVCKGWLKVNEFNQDDKECDLEVHYDERNDFVERVHRVIS